MQALEVGKVEDYRKRCYDSYVNTSWKHTHNMSEKEYVLLRKVYQNRFKKYLPENKDARILDVACGPGHFLSFLQKEGYKHAQGIDISDEQLALASKMGVQNIKKADLFSWLSDNKAGYDLIVAFDIIEHLHKPEIIKALDLINSALKPNGNIIIGVPNASSLFGSGSVHINFTHETGLTPKSISQIIRVCGFNNVHVKGEKPVIHDFRSTIRAGAWAILRNLISLYLLIEGGSGRGLWQRDNIIESRMFAVGYKQKT